MWLCIALCWSTDDGSFLDPYFFHGFFHIFFKWTSSHGKWFLLLNFVSLGNSEFLLFVSNLLAMLATSWMTYDSFLYPEQLCNSSNYNQVGCLFLSDAGELCLLFTQKTSVFLFITALLLRSASSQLLDSFSHRFFLMMSWMALGSSGCLLMLGWLSFVVQMNDFVALIVDHCWCTCEQFFLDP